MTNPRAFNLDRLMTDEELVAALRLIEAADARFRIYDLHNNPLSTEELHNRVFDWYERQTHDTPEMARWRQRQGLPRVRRERPDAFLRRSHGQRRSAR